MKKPTNHQSTHSNSFKDTSKSTDRLAREIEFSNEERKIKHNPFAIMSDEISEKIIHFSPLKIDSSSKKEDIIIETTEQKVVNKSLKGEIFEFKPSTRLSKQFS